MGHQPQNLVVDSTLYSLVVFLLLYPLDVIRYSGLDLELLFLMIYNFGSYLLFFCVSMPYRKHHFCQAPQRSLLNPVLF